MSPGEVRSHWRDRGVGLALLLPSSVVIGLARWLEPSSTGVGTHLQLGLAECFVLETLGLPCPMCGMTTTFSLMAHLDVVTALLNQPFGVVLFLMTLGAGVVGFLDLVKPAQRWRRVARWAVARDWALAAVLLGTMIGGWVYKIALMKKILPWAP